MRTLSLPSAELALLRAVFRRHPEIREVRLFGSRAKGAETLHSDIDLALWGNLDALKAEAIAAELDELPLPYRYDVLPFDSIKSRPLREHIERVGVPLYPGPVLDRTRVPPSSEQGAWFRELTEGRMEFWELACEISCEELSALIDIGLRETRGSYRKLAELFHLPDEDYRRLMDFLRRSNCMLDATRFRSLTSE